MSGGFGALFSSGAFAGALQGLGGGKGEEKPLPAVTTPDPAAFVSKYTPGLSQIIRSSNPSLSQGAAELIAEGQIRDTFKGVMARSRQMAGK